MNIFEKYGYCIIPKNTYLFRTFEDTALQKCMFFTLKSTYFWNSSIRIKQVWRTTKQIKIVFLVKYLGENANAVSTIINLYNDLFPNDLLKDTDDLVLKRDNFIKREKFTTKLFKEHQVSGWFSSIENGYECEVCLFDLEENIQQLELLKYGNIDISKCKYNSLKRIKFFPTNSFYEISKTKISSTYYSYNKTKNYHLKECKAEGMDIFEKEKIDTYDLRIKLKI